ncbi:MAG: PIN domain-containing protein [Flavobacteriales bacterium]
MGLRKKDQIKLPDALIAATAIHHQLPLITADNDFKAFEGLMLMLYSVK